MSQTTHYKIKGEEKTRYLHQLDKILASLTTNLAVQEADYSAAVQEFGKKEGWNWQRLPAKDPTYKILHHIVAQVRREYQWFDTIEAKDNPLLNRRYFDAINISAHSGLPWAFDFIDLHKTKEKAAALLGATPDYRSLYGSLQRVLLDDFVLEEEVPESVAKIKKSAMRRNFLEQLEKSELLDWQGVSAYGLQAEKRFALGGEEFWNLVLTRYVPGASLFESYIVDFWQDVFQKEVTEGDNGVVVVSHRLQKAFNFSPNNTAWYVLKSLDNKFAGLHPVHVSRAIIGPFGNKYQTHPEADKLALTDKLLSESENENAAAFRFSRQYNFAPNHREKDKKLQQIIYQEDWRDEVIVTQAQYAAKASGSLLGTAVRVFDF